MFHEENLWGAVPLSSAHKRFHSARRGLHEEWSTDQTTWDEVSTEAQPVMPYKYSLEMAREKQPQPQLFRELFSSDTRYF